MSKISRFTKKAVQLAKNAVGGRGEVAAPEGGGGFAEYAVLSLHCLRVYLEKSYRKTLDLLSEMPQILGEIGLDATDLPDHSTLVKWFDRIKTALWRVLLRLSAQLHDPSGHAAIDATFFPRNRQQTLLSSDELPRPDTQNDCARRHRKPRDSGRSLYDRETPRHTARLAGRPPQRGRPRQPRCRQGL
jgi:IS5 family transposase